MRFTEGIHYAFPAGTMLAPGARLTIPFAEFANESRLNNGSDRIKLEDATNSTIQEFTYGDEFPWPPEADGGGFSIVLINPTTSPDHRDPANWRGSVAPGELPMGRTGDPLPGIRTVIRMGMASAPISSLPPEVRIRSPAAVPSA